MKLQDNLKDYRDRILPCNPAFATTMPQIIDLINLYWNSRYRSGNYDENSQRKSFFNIVHGPTWVKTKEIDLDIKNILLRATSPNFYLKVWFLTMELRHKLLKDHWGSFLNRLAFEISKSGEVIVKKNKGNVPKIVDLRNFYVDPTAKTLETASYIIEKFLLLPSEFEQRWAGKRLPVKDKNGYISIYEWYQPAGDGWEKRIQDSGKDLEEMVVVGSLPYKATGDEKVAGRFLHRGTVEKLFENQIEVNLIAQYKRMSMAWGSKQLFQSADPNVIESLVGEAVNGTVVKTRAPIERIPTEERNLSAYASEESRWDKNTRERSFAQEVVSGERLPSGTRLGTVALQAQTTGNYFDLLRENFGLFVKSIIEEWILPDLAMSQGGKHILRVASGGEEIDRLDQIVVNQRLNEDVRKYLMTNHVLPPRQVYETMKSVLQNAIHSMDNRYIDVPAGFYKNLDYEMEIIVTGESIDVGARLASLRGVLDLFAVQPQLRNDPSMKRIITEILSLVGLDPNLLDANPEPAPETAELQRGGTLPKQASVPQPGMAPTNVAL